MRGRKRRTLANSVALGYCNGHILIVIECDDSETVGLGSNDLHAREAPEARE